MSEELGPYPSYRQGLEAQQMPRETNALPVQFDEYPGDETTSNGGWMAWLQVVGGFLVIFNAQGLIQSYGVFQAYYEAVLLPNESPAKIAWIGSFQIFFLFFMCIVVSPLIDKGYFRSCFSGGCFLMFIAILVTSWCHKWWELFLVQGILTGVGMGAAFGSGLLVLKQYFSTHLGTAAGLTSAGGSVGGMVYPAIAEQLVLNKGFPFTLRIFAALAGITLLIANALVRQHPNSNNGKPQLGRDMFRDIPFLLMSAGFFFTLWGIYFAFYYIVTYAQTHLHLTSHSSVTLLILINATNLPGRLLPPFLSDRRLGHVNTIIPAIFLTSLFLFVWIAAETQTAITVVACFYGFASGAVQGLYNPAIWSFPSDEDPANGRARVAFVFFWISIAALTGTPIGGTLIKHQGGGYLHAQLFAAVTVLVGGCFVVAARVAKVGWGVVKF